MTVQTVFAPMSWRGWTVRMPTAVITSTSSALEKVPAIAIPESASVFLDTRGRRAPGRPVPRTVLDMVRAST